MIRDRILAQNTHTTVITLQYTCRVHTIIKGSVSSQLSKLKGKNLQGNILC